MARKSRSDAQAVQQVVAAFLKLPWKVQVAIVALVLLVGGIVLTLRITSPQSPAQPQANPQTTSSPEPTDLGGLTNVPPVVTGFPDSAKSVVFCLWNMENVFDDKFDRRNHSADKEFDAWFSSDASLRQLKYQRLTEALLRFNHGIGPDIIVGIEIESYRAAELLKNSLNSELPAQAAPYEHVAMKELNAGRHIAPAVIARYPLSRAQLHGRLQRILEVHVTVNGHELVIVASHWTSQISDDGKRESGGRAGYAATIAKIYEAAIQTNPHVDFLVCGDFNDTPESETIRTKLGMIADSRLVTPNARPPRLYGLLSGKSPEKFGTHYYNEPLIYDQIGVSPGLLDTAGWGLVPDSVQVPTEGLIRSGTRARRPWRFGSRTDDAVGRGYSDHFPVLATFQVAP